MEPSGRSSGDGQPGDAPSQGDGGMVALLSLNLLLLAFFILLTTLASFEQQRLAEVVRSVNDAFDGRVRVTVPDEATAVGEWPVPQASPTLSALGQLFRSNFPLARLEVDTERGEMRMLLDSGGVFPDGGTRPGPAAARLFDGLAAELQARGDAAYEIELFHGYETGDRGRLADSAGRDPIFLRAGALVGALSDRGIEESSLSAGLVPGEADQVRVVLRLWGGPGEPQAPRRNWR